MNNEKYNRFSTESRLSQVTLCFSGAIDRYLLNRMSSSRLELVNVINNFVGISPRSLANRFVKLLKDILPDRALF